MLVENVNVQRAEAGVPIYAGLGGLAGLLVAAMAAAMATNSTTTTTAATTTTTTQRRAEEEEEEETLCRSNCGPTQSNRAFWRH